MVREHCRIKRRRSTRRPPPNARCAAAPRSFAGAYRCADSRACPPSGQSCRGRCRAEIATHRHAYTRTCGPVPHTHRPGPSWKTPPAGRLVKASGRAPNRSVARLAAIRSGRRSAAVAWARYTWRTRSWSARSRRVRFTLAPHVAGGEPMQLVVQQRQQPVACGGVVTGPRGQQFRNLVRHSSTRTQM
jgi:hypothetical protein